MFLQPETAHPTQESTMSDSTTRNVRVRNSILLPSPGCSWDQSRPHQQQWTRQDDDSGMATRRRMTLDIGSTHDVHRSQALPALSAPSSSEGVHWVPHSAGAIMECDTDKPPPGCAPDAIKLFVGSIPKSCTESQLLPFFETIGKVVDLVIVRDKATRESKGSAFLWYASRAHAEVAILHFNLRHVLPDPSGEHHRPLVLRRAKPRAQPGPPLSASSQASSQPTSGQLTPQPPASGQTSTYTQAQQAVQPLSMNSQPSRPNSAQLGASHQGMMFPAGESLPSQIVAASLNVSRSLLMTELLTQACNGANGTGQQRSPPSWGSLNQGQAAYADAPSSVDDVGSIMMALRSTQLADMHTAPMPAMASQPELLSMAGGGCLESPSGAGSATQSMPLVSATLDLTSQQMTLVNQYMHSLQNISGAQLSVSVGPSTFRLRVSGLEPQVETAKTLLATVMYTE